MQSTVDRLPFTLKHHVRHSAAVLRAAEQIGSDLGGSAAGDSLGGMLRNGHLAYLAVGSLLEVVMTKSGVRVASCNFDSLFSCTTHITCVAELPLPHLNTCLLAVGLDSAQNGGLVCLFAVHGAQLLRTVELVDKVTAVSFVADRAQCERLGDLRMFDGCLAVGMHSGKVVLLDLRLQQCADVLFGRNADGGGGRAAEDAAADAAAVASASAAADCLIVLANVPPAEMRVQQKNAAAEEINFGVQLPLLTDAGAVLCALVLRPLQALAVGLSDGRLVLYTLRTGAGFEAFHLAHPCAGDAPLLRLALCEPADDPRACVYLWAMHVHADASTAVMHSIMYERKRRVPAAAGGYCNQYEGFQSCSVRLQVPLFERESYPIACQAVRRTMNGGKGGAANDDDGMDDEEDEESDTLSLCVLAWTSKRTASTQTAVSTVCVFDLNQWYKEQMPYACDWRRAGNSFLAVFPLGDLAVLDVWLDACTLTPFASQQRPEEHFWPSSLNFECTALTAVESCRVRWPGLQNQALELLVQSGPQALLEPHQCFDTMIRASLVPQFTDYHPNEPQTISAKQLFLLSIALEYNCTALLRDCALAWADGSHLGAGGQQPGGLSLSTLTDWLWSRAGATKACCNQLCVPLFDHTGMRLDVRSRQQLLNCTRQLRTLADLMATVLARCGRYIPGEVRVRLESQRDAIRMAFEYQEVLQWLLNMGLLPEGAPSAAASQSSSPDGFGREAANGAVPYPYRALRQFYAAQRQKYRDIDAGLLNAKRSCRVLYIDAFIEHQCNPACLRSEWRQAGADGQATAGDGLYPPASLQAMLRTLLVPGVPADVKHTLFVYLFLDLSVALSDERFVGVVQRLIKFPAVFRLSPALIKTTQAFWNLDHGQPETAIEELISPLSQERQLLPWQQETLIEALLVQDAAQLALRALRAPRPPIAPLLEIRTLLANNLVSEAFQLQRARADQRLLAELFRTCHAQRKWHFVLDLSLTAGEEQCLGEFLRTCDSALTENLHFVYLLQRGKYTEAIAFVDDLHHNRRTATTATSAASLMRRRAAADLDTPSTILAAYKLTMTPASRSLAGMYHSLRDNINAKLNAAAPASASAGAAHPHPLSSKLLQHKLDLLGGVYHRSVLCAEQTNPAYWFNRPQRMCSLTAGNVPFLRNPQYDMAALAQRQLLQHAAHGGQLSYAVEYVASGKRSAQAQRQADNAPAEADRAEGPLKRRRVDPAADDTADVMAVLRAKRTAAVSEVGTPKQQQRPPAAGGTDTLLSTPVVLVSNKSTLIGMQVATPQSILKAKPSPPSSELVADTLDEKSIRFALPGGESETDEEINMDDVDDAAEAAAVMGANEDVDNLSAVAPTATSTVRDSPNTHRDLNWPVAPSPSVSCRLDSSVEEFRTPDETPVELSVCVEEPQPEQMPVPAAVDDDADGTTDESNNYQLVSPPAADRSKLVFSQQPSPLQRRINLGEGPKPRKRLRSSVPREAEPPLAVDAAPALVISDKKLVAARKSKAEQEQPQLRRSSRSRSRTPDVTTAEHQQPEPSPSTAVLSRSLVASKAATPLGRKPLSRLVLEANAKKTIAEGKQLQAAETVIVVDSSSSSSSSNASSALPEVAAAGIATVDVYSDEEPSFNITQSSVTGALMTDDSQRFLDYVEAKKPQRVDANMSRRISISSMDDTTADSAFAGIPAELMDDSDASFEYNQTRRVDSSEEGADDDVQEEPYEDYADEDDDDADEEDVNVEVENAFEHSPSSNSYDSDSNSADTNDDSNSNQYVSPAKSAFHDPADVINISSSSEDSATPAAVGSLARPQDHNDSSSDDEDDATGANVSDQVQVVAVVHSEPSFDTEPESNDAAAIGDSGHFQSANSSTVAAQLYGDLEAIQRADEVHAVVRSPRCDWSTALPVAARFDEAGLTGDPDNVPLQIDDDSNSCYQSENTSYSDLHNQQLQPSNTVEQTTVSMMTDDDADESGALNQAQMQSDVTEMEESNATGTTTLNHAIICETAGTDDFPMNSVDEEDTMQTAHNTLGDDVSVDVMDQGGYLLEETASTPAMSVVGVSAESPAPVTDDEPSPSQISAEQNSETIAALEAAVDAMDDEPIATPSAKSPNQLASPDANAVEGRTDPIVSTPTRATRVSARARSISIDTEQNLETIAALEAAVDAMDDEPIATPSAEPPITVATSSQQAIAKPTQMTDAIAVADRTDTIVSTPVRATRASSRARSISIDAETAPATPQRTTAAMTEVAAHTSATKQRRASLRARSIDPEAAPATPVRAHVAALPTDTPTSARRRLRSSSQLDLTPASLTPQPATTPQTRQRQQRGQSEPKQMAAVVDASGSLRRAASVRRLLQESNVLQPLVESALADEAVAAKTATPTTPKRRAGRPPKQGTPAPDETPATPSATGTPSRRQTLHNASQNTSPAGAVAASTAAAAPTGTPKRTTARSQRAASVAADTPEPDADDDASSVVSHGSRRSTRSSGTKTSSRKTKKPVAEEEVDDDFDDSASVKSNKSTRSTTTKRANRATVLPAIDELRETTIAEEEREEDNADDAADGQHGQADFESASSSYSNSRRLTRHQISVMDRMNKTSDAVAAAASSSTASAATRRTRRASSVMSSTEERGGGGDDNDDDDEEDDDGRKSVQSARSNRSRRSKKADEPKTMTAGTSLESIVELDDMPAAAQEKTRTKTRKAKK